MFGQNKIFRGKVKGSFDLVLSVCGRDCAWFVVSIYVNMDMYSLEDDDNYGELFITQSGSGGDGSKLMEISENVPDDGEFLELDRTDLQSP